MLKLPKVTSTYLRYSGNPVQIFHLKEARKGFSLLYCLSNDGRLQRRMFNGVGKLCVSLQLYGGIHADVIVYIFPHLHTAYGFAQRNKHVRYELTPDS